MHYRNAFREQNLNFKLVAGRQEDLKPFIERRSESQWRLNFKSWVVTRALNSALLIDAYELGMWDLPRFQLCPPVANRANYIHWLEDLLLQSRPSGVAETGASVRGLDVGVGASCVFPLLGASINGWSFVGVDIVDIALSSAIKNVRNNPRIAGLIEIRDGRMSEVIPSRNLSKFNTLLGVKNEEQFSFCMCNPPFFDLIQDAKLNPGTNFGGTTYEMCHPGGEEAFTQRIFDESLVLRERVHWYTTMCGKMRTLRKILHLLEVARVPTIRTTRFLQGRTTRWGIAWSFSSQPRLQELALPLQSKIKDVHGE
jgi:23S rRNA (adenine1618-N6)-methyltransferase